MKVIPIHTAFVAAKKGSTRDGLVTLEYRDVAAAAHALGGVLDATPHEVYRIAERIGGRKVANGHYGQRFGFAPGVLERSTAFAPGVNHLGGDGLAVRLVASLTFPVGLDLTEFNYEWPTSAADLRTFDAAVVESEGVRVSHAAIVTLNMRPHGEDSANLKLLVPAEHSDTPGASVTRAAGADRVTLNVRFPDGSAASLSGGALICRHLSGVNHQFTFFFTDINQGC